MSEIIYIYLYQNKILRSLSASLIGNLQHYGSCQQQLQCQQTSDSNIRTIFPPDDTDVVDFIEFLKNLSNFDISNEYRIHSNCRLQNHRYSATFVDMPEIDLYSIALLFSGLDHAYGNHYKWLFILIVLVIDFEYVGTVYRCRIRISTKKMPAHTHSRKPFVITVSELGLFSSSMGLKLIDIVKARQKGFSED